MVSWISFLIPPDIVPGRMALLITLFLVLINIFNNVTTNSERVDSTSLRLTAFYFRSTDAAYSPVISLFFPDG